MLVFPQHCSGMVLKSHLLIIGNDIVERSCKVYCCSGDTKDAILFQDRIKGLLR